MLRIARSKEMSPASPRSDVLSTNKLQESFMHQSRGLQGLTRLFQSQLSGRQFAKLFYTSGSRSSAA
jgi:hypothetical protein